MAGLHRPRPDDLIKDIFFSLALASGGRGRRIKDGMPLACRWLPLAWANLFNEVAAGLELAAAGG